MIIVSYIIFGLLFFRLLIVIINLLTKLKLSRQSVNQAGQLVSILIPARNEKENIGRILKEIQKQEYENYEVIVYDDESEDETYMIVNEFARNDNRYRVIKGGIVPRGWIGKNYACFQLGLNAKGDYFLFLDADVSISTNILENALAILQKRNLKLFSIFPKQQMNTVGEKLTVPVMNWILLSLLPMYLIFRCRWASFSAANGQFMLFDAENYKKHSWHEVVKCNRVEDIQILRLMKKAGYKVTTYLGDDRIRCRMYTDYTAGVKGFSKNVLAFFSNSMLFMIVFTLISVFGILFIAVFLHPINILLYCIAGILIHVFISLKSEQSVLDNLIFLLPRQLTFVLIVINSIIHKIKGNTLWKGRFIITK